MLVQTAPLVLFICCGYIVWTYSCFQDLVIYTTLKLFIISLRQTMLHQTIFVLASTGDSVLLIAFQEMDSRSTDDCQLLLAHLVICHRHVPPCSFSWADPNWSVIKFLKSMIWPETGLWSTFFSVFMVQGE